MFGAILLFSVYLTLLAIVGIQGLKTGRITLVSFALILSILTIFRQVIFFAGLDVPSPQTHLGETEWELVSLASVVCIVWVIFVMAGYVLSAGSAQVFAHLLPRGPQTPHGGAAHGTRFVVLVSATFAIGGTLYLIAQSGGVAQFAYAQKIGKAFKGLFVIKEATTLTSLLAIYGLLSNVVKSKTGKARIGWRGTGYLLIIVASMAANYSWGNRYNIALTLIVLGLSWHYYVAPLRFLRTLILAVIVMAFLQFLREIRGGLLADVRGASFQGLDNKWLEISASLHFVEFDALLLVLRDTGDLFDYRQGADFYNGLLSWVPRSIYADKESFNIGPWFRRVYQPTKINGWPVTVMGAWYVNFAWIGIPIGGLISGFIMRVIDAAYRDVKSNPWHASIGTGIAIFVIEGGVNTGFPQSIFLLFVPLALASMWMKNVSSRNLSRQNKVRKPLSSKIHVGEV